MLPRAEWRQPLGSGQSCLRSWGSGKTKETRLAGNGLKWAGLVGATGLAFLGLFLLDSEDPEAGRLPDARAPMAGGDASEASGGHEATLPLLRFRPKEGEALAYEFSWESDLDTDLAALLAQATGKPVEAGERMTVLTKAAGLLNLKFYARDAHSFDVAGRLSGVTFTLDGETPGFFPQLQYPFYFQMTDRGKISGLTLTTGAGLQASGAIENLVLSMQIVGPKQPRTQWSVQQDDATGEYLAKYSLKTTSGADWTLRRSHGDYLKLHARGPQTGLQPQTRVSLAQTVASVTPGEAWVRTVDDTQEVTQTLGGVVLAEAKSRFQAERTETGNAAAFPSSFSAFEVDVASDKWAREKMYQTDPAFNRLAEGLNLSGVVELFLRIRDVDSRKADAFLVNYLRLNPAAARLLAQRLEAAGSGFDTKTRNDLWSAIARSGHPEAQRAILATVSNPEVGAKTRITAMAYVSDFEYPTEQTIDDLWQQYEEAGGDPHGTEGEIKTMSLFALGALGHDAKLQPGEKSQIGDMLVKGLDEADSEWNERMALMAIGNFGSSSALDVVAARFGSEDDAVRGAAYDAVRKMSDPRAQQLLMDAYDRDTVPALRLQVLKTLGEMRPLAEKTSAWVRSKLKSVRHEQDLVLLVTILGKNLNRQNEAALRELLATEPSVGIQRAVYRYIGPR